MPTGKLDLDTPSLRFSFQVIVGWAELIMGKKVFWFGLVWDLVKLKQNWVTQRGFHEYSYVLC